MIDTEDPVSSRTLDSKFAILTMIRGKTGPDWWTLATMWTSELLFLLSVFIEISLQIILFVWVDAFVHIGVGRFASLNHLFTSLGDFEKMVH